MGYGAMHLAGPGVWGLPRDPDAAVAVLRERPLLELEKFERCPGF